MLGGRGGGDKVACWAGSSGSWLTEEVFFSAFLHCFAFTFGLGDIGGMRLQRVVCAVVVGGGCGGVVWR